MYETLTPESVANPAPPLVDVQEADPQERLATCERLFLELAKSDFSPEAEDYINSGGSLRLLLSEIRALSEPSIPDQALTQARLRFMEQFMPRSPIMDREMHVWSLQAAEDEYVRTILLKIDAHLSADTPEEALKLQQMPTLVEETGFKDGEDIDLEMLAGNHLYIIIDTLLKEHVLRHEAIADFRSQSVVARIAGNRVLRFALGGMTFGAAAAAHLNVLPESNEALATEVEWGLKCLAGGMLVFEMPELIRHVGSVRRQRKKKTQLHDQISETYESTDLAMQISCSKPRYGDKKGTGVVTNRGGTHDKKENLRRLNNLDDEFDHMNNDPGGRPYSGQQAVASSARLLVEHRDMVDAIIEPGLTASERRMRYLTLAETMAREDIARTKKNQSPHHLRELFLNALLATTVAEMPEVTAALGDAKTLGRDTSHFHLHERDV